MAEKVKDKGTDEVERKMLLGFYQVGEEVVVETNVDPWVERQLGELLLQRSQEVLGVLLERCLREQYSREVKG